MKADGWSDTQCVTITNNYFNWIVPHFAHIDTDVRLAQDDLALGKQVIWHLVIHCHKEYIIKMLLPYHYQSMILVVT